MRLFVLFAACHGSRTVEVAIPEPGPPPGSPEAALRSGLDTTVDPCVDFYAHACGTWIRDHPMPADEVQVFRTLTTIEDHNAEVLRTVLEEATESPEEDPDRQKLAAFWTACMDEDGIALRGLEPLAETLAAIDGLRDRQELLAVVGDLHAAGFDVLFDVGVDADPKNPGLAILQLRQAGTSLPDREFYLADDRADIRDEYRQYATRLFVLSGWTPTDAARAAVDVLAFETRLAEVQVKPAALRDATLTHNKLDRKGLEKLAPGVDWGAFLASQGRPELTQINVLTPSFFAGMSKLVAGTDLATLRTYLVWRVLDGSARDLARPFADEAFRFHDRLLSGQAQPQPRWKHCVAEADAALGDLLARAYVERAFAGESQSVAMDMITRIEGAFEAGLPDLGWMDDDTRARAVEKARAITNKIGHPEHWREYGFDVRADDHFGNVRRAAQHGTRFWVDQVEKPIDPDIWQMTAQTVNASYNPSQNEIVFPAGILQPPIFSVAWPKAMNFGAMGTGMGHELIHGFDDQGRRYDAEGRFTDWWAPSAIERFDDAAACVEAQYDRFEVEPGLPLNGELTLGENLADLGGARIAYRAYRGWVAENGEEPAVAGLKGDQLFFVSLAQAWCAVASPEVQRMRVATDPRSPPRFRVNGTLVNLPEFGDAFGCEVGEPMRPAEICEVW